MVDLNGLRPYEAAFLALRVIDEQSGTLVDRDRSGVIELASGAEGAWVVHFLGGTPP